MLCFGYNINKLHIKIQKDRLGNHLISLLTEEGAPLYN